ncbi:two-component response regulator [Pseudomonas aeruginosa]|nr:two-component response regulator [Pseudomonas aeruginosa]
MPAGLAETDDLFPMDAHQRARKGLPRRTGPLPAAYRRPILIPSPFMPNPDLSILVVDDAKFSSAMIGRALSQAGYQDIRFASSASEALQAARRAPGQRASRRLADAGDGRPGTDRPGAPAGRKQQPLHLHVVLLTGKEGRERPRRGLRPRRRRLRQQGGDERATGAAHLCRRSPVQHPAAPAGGKPSAHREHRADGGAQPGGYPHRPRQPALPAAEAGRQPAPGWRPAAAHCATC